LVILHVQVRKLEYSRCICSWRAAPRLRAPRPVGIAFLKSDKCGMIESYDRFWGAVARAGKFVQDPALSYNCNETLVVSKVRMPLTCAFTLNASAREYGWPGRLMRLAAQSTVTGLATACTECWKKRQARGKVAVNNSWKTLRSTQLAKDWEFSGGGWYSRSWVHGGACSAHPCYCLLLLLESTLICLVICL
jgi:hypothetical protein